MYEIAIFSIPGLPSIWHPIDFGLFLYFNEPWITGQSAYNVMFFFWEYLLLQEQVYIFSLVKTIGLILNNV